MKQDIEFQKQIKMTNIIRIIGVIIFSIYIGTTFVMAETIPVSDKAKYPSVQILKEMIPDDQQNVMAQLEAFSSKYEASNNAIQRYLLRKERQKFLSEVLESRVLTEWLGRIKTLKTTSKGKAYLEIEIAAILSTRTNSEQKKPTFKVTVGTWNNAYTDLDYNTLILPETEFHEFLVNFEEGEWVLFSGNGFPGEEDYFKESSASESDSMLSPNFIIKYDFLEKVEFPETEPVYQQLVLQSSTDKKAGFPASTSQVGTKKATLQSTENQQVRRINSLIPTINLRYYQNYRLSRYDWDYQNYIGRWEKLIRFHWRNHPPVDYLQGKIPDGGEIYVLAVVERDGRIREFQLNTHGKVTETMKQAVLEAVRVVPVPPLPEDFPYPELRVEFRFNHPSMPFWVVPDSKSQKEKVSFQKSVGQKKKKNISKLMLQKIKKQKIKKAGETYLDNIEHQLAAHFSPHQKFYPDLEMEVELLINPSGKIIQRKITEPGQSERFQLMVMNGLRKAKLMALPKILRESGDFKVRVRITP